MITDPLYWFLCFFGVIFYWLSSPKLRFKLLFLISFSYFFPISPLGMLLLSGWAYIFYRLSTSRAKTDILPTFFVPIAGILCYLICIKYILSDIFSRDHEMISLSFLQLGFLHLGISYFTFKFIHYAIEIRRDTLPSHTFDQFLAYIFFLPVFTAGPIERFDHFLRHQYLHFQIESVIYGLFRISHGLIKKFVIVDLLLDTGILFNLPSPISADTLQVLPPLHVWGILAVTYLSIYLDFSAYSDIAIGTSRLFGFTIMENFNWPILAPSIVHFWKRWHMSLTSWVQSYVYMPLLGVYRNPILAVYASFFIIGFWHELTLNRFLWGIYHATASVICSYWSRRTKTKRRIPNNSKLKRAFAILSTQLFLVTSMIFLLADNERVWKDSLALFLKIFFVDCF